MDSDAEKRGPAIDADGSECIGASVSETGDCAGISVGDPAVWCGGWL